MKTIILFIFIFLISPTMISQTNSFEGEVDDYLKPYIELNDFSGTILIAKSNKILLEKGYGMANYELNIPNNPQFKYHIASLSKTFTAAAIVLLEKQGLLGFDDPLSKFLPDFPNSHNIKISHLLTHSSGVPDFYALPEYEDFKNDPMTLPDWIALLKTKPLDFEPGEQNSYSNSGYALLAFIIEKISNMSYGDFLHEQIFKPLKMKIPEFGMI